MAQQLWTVCPTADGTNGRLYAADTLTVSDAGVLTFENVRNGGYSVTIAAYAYNYVIGPVTNVAALLDIEPFDLAAATARDDNRQDPPITVTEKVD